MMNKLIFKLRVAIGLEQVFVTGWNHPQQGEISMMVVHYDFKSDIVTINRLVENEFYFGEKITREAWLLRKDYINSGGYRLG